MLISNVATLLTLWIFIWLISNYSAEHNNLAVEIMKVRKDLSSTMRYLESPVYMENADRSRKIWIDDLVKALSNEQCRIRVAGMDDLEHSGYYSETISFFLLIGGLVFLVKIAYTEHLAYCSMKSEEEKERSQRKRKNNIINF